MEVAYLAIGGNIGDVEAGIIAALNELSQPPIMEVEACSSIYRTEPVGGPPGQSDYMNAAVRVRTELTPRQLLANCLKIEQDMGRIRHARWAPRTIDIDILLYGGDRITEPNLTIPHPRMRERLFVLMPLSEVAPAMLALPPDDKPLRDALDEALLEQQTTAEEYRRKIVAAPNRFCK